MGVLSLSHRLVKALATVETKYCDRINAKNYWNLSKKDRATYSSILQRNFLAFLLPDKLIIFNGDTRKLGVTVIKVIHLNKNDLRGDTNFKAIDITPLSYVPDVTRVTSTNYRMITPFNTIKDLVRLKGLQAGERVKLEYEGNAAKRVYYSDNANYEVNSLIQGEIRKGMFKVIDWISNHLSGDIHFGGDIDVSFAREMIKIKHNPKSGYSSFPRQTLLGQLVKESEPERQKNFVLDAWNAEAVGPPRQVISLGIKTEDGETGLCVGNISQKPYLRKRNAEKTLLPPDTIEAFIPADLPPTNVERRMLVGKNIWKYIPDEPSLCYGLLDYIVEDNPERGTGFFFIGFNGWEGELNSFTLLLDNDLEKSPLLHEYYPNSV